MNAEQAIELCRKTADEVHGRHNPGVTFHPHDWCVKAVQAAYALGAAQRAPHPPAADERDASQRFLADVAAELQRARSKFPGDRIMTIALAEEFGELCKAVLDEPADACWKEAVQCAAMAARVVIDGDGSVKDWREQKGLNALTDAALAGKEGR